MVKLSPDERSNDDICLYEDSCKPDRRDVVQDFTIDSSLISTPHDRKRREERGIVKIDLQRARRYGMVEDGKYKGTKRYTYGGKIFVYDERNKKAITSWKIKGSNAGSNAGTRKVNPILIEKSQEHDTPQAKRLHNKIKNTLITRKKEWRSHSVLVIDMSGMKHFYSQFGCAFQLKYFF